MNVASPIQTLYLQVMNPEVLEGGALPAYNFDHYGGTIGCKGANWLLHDYTCAVAEIHAEITMRDNHYCLIDRSGRTGINSGTEYIGLNRIIQINTGDLLHIGKYRIKVIFHEVFVENVADAGLSELAGKKAHAHRKGYLLAPAADDEVSLIYPDVCRSNTVDNSILINAVPEEIVDPLAAFSKPPVTVNKHDENTNNDCSTFDDITYNDFISDKGCADDGETVKDKFSGNITAMNDIPKAPGDLKQSENYDPYSQNTGLNHIVIAPLLRGMGISIEEMDAERAHDFLIEVGKAIKATVSGIQNLYQQEQSTALNPSLLGRNLQPIEDNPLRLKQSYEKTADALFSPSRSRVHLAPPAAIEESLSQLGQHQDAVIFAIQESLDTLVQSFSPDMLKSRFQRYAKAGKQNNQDDAWAWQMYGAYYSELISSRQIGFEKLFWEVFEQAYDRAMRQAIHNKSKGRYSNEY